MQDNYFSYILSEAKSTSIIKSGPLHVSSKFYALSNFDTTSPGLLSHNNSLLDLQINDGISSLEISSFF